MENLSFDIDEKTITALVGESRSDKTTITNLLLRFYDVHKGKITLGRIDIRDIPYDELLDRISIVMQNVQLFDNTIEENIGFLAKVYEAVSTGTGPDIIFNYASTAADYIPDGLIVDQSKYMESDYKARVSEGIYTESTGFEDGGLYVVAVQSTGPILFYNKTMFDKVGFSAPKTWDEVEEAAKAIYAEYKIPGFAFD